jgi:hypothetical protein
MKRAVILVVVVSLIGLCPVLPSLAQQKPAQAGAAAEQTRGMPLPGQIAEKPWPRSYKAPSGATIVIHQPQAASWDDQKRAVAYAAVSYLAAGQAEKPALGTVKIEADTSVSLEERLVKFSVLKITEANFQPLSKDQIREIVAELEKTIPDEDRVIALDRVIAAIDKSRIIPKNVEGIKADPPVIFFSKAPALLLNIDGDPVWSPIKENDLKFAVNTNWDLFQHPPTSSYYLRDDAAWLKASDVKGPWVVADKLPDSFKKLPKEEWKDVRDNLKSKKPDHAPTVFVSTRPAELIALQGEPRYFPVVGTGTNLLWVSNTESDLFRLGENGPVYYLVAGRWFTAPDFTGPWTFATPALPPDFKLIPLDHPRSRVRASAPGTEEAAEAVLFAQIPQTARVNKKEVKAPEVVYNGNPEFASIEGTSVERAVNTDKDIIKVGDAYYMCFDGVWFLSSSPSGPWAVTDSVPGQVYEIPPSSPAYNVTYVTVKEDDDDDDDWVEFAAAAGYWGTYCAWGCDVWGTGWYYDPYYGYGGYYPIYYPPLRTYGYGSWYNPRTGFYGTAGRIYGPYGGVIRSEVQPDNRDIRARSHGLGSEWGPRRGPTLEPAHRHVCGDTPGLRRLRKLGVDLREARRRVGADQTIHQS